MWCNYETLRLLRVKHMGVRICTYSLGTWLLKNSSWCSCIQTIVTSKIQLFSRHQKITLLPVSCCSKTSIWSIKKENKKEKNSHTFASVAFFMNAPIAPIACGELQLISLCVYWKIGFNWCNCASLSLLLSLTNTLSHFPAGSLLWGQQLSITRSELSSDLRLAAAIICMMRVVWAHVSNVMWTSVFSNPMQKFSRP